MESSAAVESSTLVVRLCQEAGGGCRLQIEGAGVSHEYALPPFTLSVQLWMPSEAPLLRAILRLHRTRHSAVLQSNRQLVELLQDWLTGEAAQADGAEAE